MDSFFYIHRAFIHEPFIFVEGEKKKQNTTEKFIELIIESLLCELIEQVKFINISVCRC